MVFSVWYVCSVRGGGDGEGRNDYAEILDDKVKFAL